MANLQKKNSFGHPIMGVKFIVWLKLLWNNAFKISAVGKGILISFVALNGEIFRGIEFLIFNRRIKKESVKVPIFIVGHPRSGTTHLYNLITKDRQFAYCTTFETFFPTSFLIGEKVFKPIMKKKLPKTRPQDNVELNIESPSEEEFAMACLCDTSYMHGFYFPQTAKQSFGNAVLFVNPKKKKNWQKNYKRFLQKVSFAKKGKQLILKSPANTGRVKELLELYPDAKFIHIHRNPYDVYVSTLRLYEKVMEKASLQKQDKQKVDEYVRYSYREMYLKFFRECELLQERQLCTISYENLIDNPLDTLQKIYADLDLKQFNSTKPAFEMAVQKVASFQKNKYKELTKTQRESFFAEQQEVFSKLGYSA